MESSSKMEKIIGYVIKAIKSKIMFFLVLLAIILCIYALCFLYRPETYRSFSYMQYLGEGFLQGHTYLNYPPHPALATLPDPYEPMQNFFYKLHDASYYNGKYYLYFGPVPALLVWIPIKLLTGIAVNDGIMVLILVSVGTSCLATLLYQISRSFGAFSRTGLAIVILSISLGTRLPYLLNRPLFYEVAVTGAYCFTAMGMLSLWRFLLNPKRYAWIICTSLCFGLAVGCRISHAFTIIILLLSYGYWTKDKNDQAVSAPVRIAAVFGLWSLCIVGLAIYNWERFGSIFENGVHYQLALWNQHNINFTTLDFKAPLVHAYLYLVKPLKWRPDFNFPFFVVPADFEMATIPWAPYFAAQTEQVYGVLTNSPFSLFFIAFLMDWRIRKHWQGEMRLIANILFICTCIPLAFLMVFFYATQRYAVDFSPWMMSVAGIYYLHLLKSNRQTKCYSFWIITGAALACYTAFTGVMMGYCGYEGCPPLATTL